MQKSYLVVNKTEKQLSQVGVFRLVILEIVGEKKFSFILVWLERALSGSHPIKLFIEIHILEFIKSIRAESLFLIGTIFKER